jgi:hypothetical protein
MDLMNATDAKNTGGLAKLADVGRVLAEGGIVRFQWVTCWTVLISADSGSYTPLDGRTYQGFLKVVAPKLERTETGSTETKNLVIEWRQG